MGRLLNLVTDLHKRTKRDHLARMLDDKVNCMKKAREYGFDYWDGDRRYGFGGYKYDGRWKPVAQKIIDLYHLKPDARILDVGCGKAHLLHELKQLLPQSQVAGFDISRYAVENAPEPIRPYLFPYRAQDRYPWGDKYFDLVLSVSSLHNLRIFELEAALREVERVGKQKYIMVESYRNEQELFNLECWALTSEAFYDTASWIWMYERFGYTGDYEFIYFE